MNSMDPEKFVEHKLEHCRQRHTWDCGIACVAMLLPPPDRKYLHENFLSICEDEGFNQSLWTIDLCYLLLRFQIPHCMFTITLGVNEDFKEQGYYTNLSLDRERVLRRFAEASSRGVRVTQASLTVSQIVRQLAAGPVILLVDATLLTCSLCKYNKIAIELRSCFPISRQYTGHYILLVGYNLSKEKFLYRNPSFADRLCAITFQQLDAARTSFGTDHDAIFVCRSYR